MLSYSGCGKMRMAVSDGSAEGVSVTCPSAEGGGQRHVAATGLVSLWSCGVLW